MTTRLGALVAQIAKERVRLKPVPRRGVGRFAPDVDQFADEPTMGSPPQVLANFRNPNAPAPAGTTVWQQVSVEYIKDFPVVDPEMDSTIGGTNPGGAAFAKLGQPL